MEKLKLVSDIAGTWVAIIGALASGIVGLWQYHNNSLADRAKTTLQYVERFNQPGLVASRRQLSNFGDHRAEEVFAKLEAGEAQLSEYIIRIVKTDDLAEHIDSIADLFDDLHACTCGKACDFAMAKRFFGKPAQEIYGLFYPYIANQRTRLKDKTYGAALEAFARAQAQKWETSSKLCELPGL